MDGRRPVRTRRHRERAAGTDGPSGASAENEGNAVRAAKRERRLHGPRPPRTSWRNGVGVICSSRRLPHARSSRRRPNGRRSRCSRSRDPGREGDGELRRPPGVVTTTEDGRGRSAGGVVEQRGTLVDRVREAACRPEIEIDGTRAPSRAADVTGLPRMSRRPSRTPSAYARRARTLVVELRPDSFASRSHDGPQR